MHRELLGFADHGLEFAVGVGALIGLLIGGRSAAAAKQVTESLRLQLNEVVRERDANRDAVTKLAALEASQLEREKAFEARIKELIDSEPGNDILSDDKLVSILQGQGVDIARRTVAKYRESLKIPSSVQRRREKALRSA